MNFETCIPKTHPIVLYLTASVKQTYKKELKRGDLDLSGIKMHAAALYEDYSEEM